MCLTNCYDFSKMCQTINFHKLSIFEGGKMEKFNTLKNFRSGYAERKYRWSLLKSSVRNTIINQIVKRKVNKF